jgi:hypothetical protein
MQYTRAEIKYYASLDPRDPDYLDLEEEHDEWVDNPEDDYIMTEPEKRGAL